ncbi:YdcF family protein [Luteimonas sp. SJ-92]|uniref:YdcF family protein n=1 Tax=Luteimonas salinisoli TaxID=2752307 RepID=A0A853JIW9_9GAMM|nr:YdcF family protein [Luteimonas salinisoli]NZA28642.1 YdcF family protein [Luteimonas salinisoli]
MASRLAHRIGLFIDRDALHALAVAAAACALSLGLVYLAYFVHVLRVARTAPCLPGRGDCVLVFGKHAPGGRIDADFEARLARTMALWRLRPPRQVVLLGGGPPGVPTEAELARGALLALGLANDAPLQLESQSRDTLQNLRNAREMLRADIALGTVTLLSSRYHLARCALLARQLGLEPELCAAEPQWRWRPVALWRVAAEAAYVCWADIGSRWARLIRHRRMLARVS